MAYLIPSLSSNFKHKIDFSLIPFGIILLEISVLTTQFSKDSYRSISDLFILRFLHSIIMLSFAFMLSRIIKKFKYTEFSYRVIATTGTLTIALGELIHAYLGNVLGVELISPGRRIGIILLQGCFWFPAFMIIGSKRTEILEHFSAYEKRLVIATRARSRTSFEFLKIQTDIQTRIKGELDNLCISLRDSIKGVWIASRTISENNQAIQPFLAGEELRKLSMNLETFGSAHQDSSFMGQNLKSVNLLIQQFKILYSTTAKKAPLRKSTYALILIALVTPPFLNYFSLREILVSYPIMCGIVFVAADVISKSLASDSPNAMRNSSILIYLTGFLPIAMNVAGQAITHNANTKYPVLATAILLPTSYYIFIKVLQVLNPYAQDLIRDNELQASQALQAAVTKVVSDEFSHTLSHRWAIYIHGKILTRLAATALKLETASNVEDETAFNEAVELLISLLTYPDSEFEQPQTDLHAEVTSRLDPWNGLLQVELHIDPELKSIRNPRVRDLGEVIEELVSNSMRHGKAQQINLWVKRVGEKDIEIIAKDNATIAPPQIQSRYGLGTRIFNLASDGRWTIERLNSSTLFTLVMTIES